MGMRHAGGPCLKVLDEAAGALPQGAVVDDVAARFEQQQVVERLQQELYRMFSLRFCKIAVSHNAKVVTLPPNLAAKRFILPVTRHVRQSACRDWLLHRPRHEPVVVHCKQLAAPHNQQRGQTASGRTSKMSMEGWWMVQTTVRPVLTVLRTVRITMAAARASSPDVGSSCGTAMHNLSAITISPSTHTSQQPCLSYNP